MLPKSPIERVLILLFVRSHLGIKKGKTHQYFPYPTLSVLKKDFRG